MKHRVEYVAVAAVGAIARRLPDAWVRAWGSALGLAFYVVDRSHRRVALANLERCFPSRSAAERRALARATFRHFGRALLQMLTFSALADEDRAARVEFEGVEHVEIAYARGRGVFFFTGHFGFWELHAIAHGHRFEPIGVVARMLDNPYLHEMLERVRQRTGNHVIYRQGAVRKIMKTLSGGHGVAVLIDQHMHSADAVWVSFFQRPAATTSALAALALRTGASVIPVFALPLPEGRFRFVYEPPVTPPAGSDAAATHEFTQRCTDVLEMYVRRHPELWLWMHRRWRDSPAEKRGMFPTARPDSSDDTALEAQP